VKQEVRNPSPKKIKRERGTVLEPKLNYKYDISPTKTAVAGVAYEQSDEVVNPNKTLMKNAEFAFSVNDTDDFFNVPNPSPPVVSDLGSGRGRGRGKIAGSAPGASRKTTRNHKKKNGASGQRRGDIPGVSDDIDEEEEQIKMDRKRRKIQPDVKEEILVP